MGNVEVRFEHKGSRVVSLAYLIRHHRHHDGYDEPSGIEIIKKVIFRYIDSSPNQITTPRTRCDVYKLN